MREHHLEYRKTLRKHLGTQSRREEEHCKSTIRKRERIYLEEAEGPMAERRGKSKHPRIEQSPKLDKKLQQR